MFFRPPLNLGKVVKMRYLLVLLMILSLGVGIVGCQTDDGDTDAPAADGADDAGAADDGAADDGSADADAEPEADAPEEPPVE